MSGPRERRLSQASGRRLAARKRVTSGGRVRYNKRCLGGDSWNSSTACRCSPTTSRWSANTSLSDTVRVDSPSSMHPDQSSPAATQTRARCDSQQRCSPAPNSVSPHRARSLVCSVVTATECTSTVRAIERAVQPRWTANAGVLADRVSSRALLLIRLFQHAPICSVVTCPARPSPRISLSFSGSSAPTKLASSIWRPAGGRTGSCVHAALGGAPMRSAPGDAGNVSHVGTRSR